MKSHILCLACLLALLIAACSSLAPPATQQAPGPAPTIPRFPTLPPTWTPVLSDTPMPATTTFTPRPTATALPPTASVPPPGGVAPSATSSILPAPGFITIVPEPLDLSDWHQFSAGGASFWLPATFEISDVAEADSVTAIEASRDASATLAAAPRQAGGSLERQVLLAISGLEGQVEVIRYEFLLGGAYVTGRLFVEVTEAESGESEKRLLYVFLHGERTWTIWYSAQPAPFEEYLSVFERSALSFAVQP
jgi:hypothetical protein